MNSDLVSQPWICLSHISKSRLGMIFLNISRSTEHKKGPERLRGLFCVQCILSTSGPPACPPPAQAVPAGAHKVAGAGCHPCAAGVHTAGPENSRHQLSQGKQPGEKEV